VRLEVIEESVEVGAGGSVLGLFLVVDSFVLGQILKDAGLVGVGFPLG
jgi:hypothetical protein